MKKLTIIFSMILALPLSGVCQKYMTRAGHISFFSHAPLEDIEADNYQVSSALNAANGEMVFAVLMKSFQFEKALMQEHFNEKYVESDKYPKATFKGSISNMSDIDLTKPGTYDVTVSGDLSIHGETKAVSADGKLIIEDGKMGAKSKFIVKPEDYKIKIPSVVRDNIAKEIEITVDITYKAVS